MWIERDNGDAAYYDSIEAYATSSQTLAADKLLLRLADPDSPDASIRSNFQLDLQSNLLSTIQSLGAKGYAGTIALIPDFTGGQDWNWNPATTPALSAKWQKAFYWAAEANALLANAGSSLLISEVTIEVEASGIPARTQTLTDIRTYQQQLWPEMHANPQFVGTGMAHGFTNLVQMAQWTSGDASTRLLDAAYCELYNMYKAAGGTTYVDAYEQGTTITPAPSPQWPDTIYSLARDEADPVAAVLGTPGVTPAASTFGYLVGSHTSAGMPEDLSRVYLIYSAEKTGVGGSLIDAFGTWDAPAAGPGAGVDEFADFCQQATAAFMPFWNATTPPNVCVFQFELLPETWVTPAPSVAAPQSFDDWRFVMWDYRECSTDLTSLVNYHQWLLGYLADHPPSRLILYVTDPAVAGNEFYDPLATPLANAGNFVGFLEGVAKLPTAVPIEILFDRSSFPAASSGGASSGWVSIPTGSPSAIELPQDWANLPRGFSWLATLLSHSPTAASVVHGLTIDPELTKDAAAPTLTNGFTDVVGPDVTGITPSSGPTAGGTTGVVISGTDLAGAMSVTIGGNAATITANTSTSITITTPAGTAGAKNVVVTTPGGTSTLTNGFTYVAGPDATGITPSSGPTAGGTTGVVISGTDLAGAMSVTIGGNAATITANTSTSITITTPAGTAGAKNVVVTTPGGTSTLTNGFTYVAALPQVSLVPTTFTIEQDGPRQVALDFTTASFTDPADLPADTVYTVKMTGSGTIQATSVGGVTFQNLGGSVYEFAGTLTDLDAYFRTPDRILYIPPLGSRTPTSPSFHGTRQLEVTLIRPTDQATSDPVMLTIVVQPNQPPVIQAPLTFAVTLNVQTPLVWPASMTPFSDASAESLTVTLAVPTGVLAAASSEGVTVSGSTDIEKQFVGSVAALNAYFKAANISYTATGTTSQSRPLTITASDGAAHSDATSTIVVHNPTPNGPPTINPTTVLEWATENQWFEITYDQLVAASGATDPAHRTVEFTLAAINSGTLQMEWNGIWIAPPTPRFGQPPPFLMQGGKIRWLPPANTVNSSGQLAFTVGLFDLNQRSLGTSQVFIKIRAAS